jgi:hypothetical protein
MAPPSIYDQILDYADRANPHPLYTEMRRTPVSRADDGGYVVSTYQEIVALLHDPQVHHRRLPHPQTPARSGLRRAGPLPRRTGRRPPGVPGDDMLSELITDDGPQGRLSRGELMPT